LNLQVAEQMMIAMLLRPPKTYLHSKKILSFVIATVVVTLQVCCDEAIALYDQKIHYGKYDVAKGL